MEQNIPPPRVNINSWWRCQRDVCLAFGTRSSPSSAPSPETTESRTTESTNSSPLRLSVGTTNCRLIDRKMKSTSSPKQPQQRGRVEGGQNYGGEVVLVVHYDPARTHGTVKTVHRPVAWAAKSFRAAATAEGVRNGWIAVVSASARTLVRVRCKRSPQDRLLVEGDLDNSFDTFPPTARVQHGVRFSPLLTRNKCITRLSAMRFKEEICVSFNSSLIDSRSELKSLLMKKENWVWFFYFFSIILILFLVVESWKYYRKPFFP